eukprot:14625890-Ditylum_brightwellii.AAC.1
MPAVSAINSILTPGIRSHLSSDKICLLKKDGIDLTTLRVKPHQDNGTPISKLSLASQLNCLADKDATTFCQACSVSFTPTKIPTKILLHKSFLIVNDIAVTNKMLELLHNQYTTSDICKYIKCKTGVDVKTMDMIVWNDLDKTLQ